MQVFIVMYQDSNGQKYADDVYANESDAKARAQELDAKTSSCWVITRNLHAKCE